MKIRRLHSAVLAMALGAGVLAGAAPAVATVQTGAPVATSGWPAPDWYRQGPHATLAACDLAFDEAANSGLYSGLAGCYWVSGGGHFRPGYYYEVYIP
ncbi:hypothetical protein [Nonomuraea longicatena]|uniref:Secreted protein n=1 Tax=Nonomuraea longicatena TaxID=83682 RepID=A0ABN1NXL6_9ACTN